MQKKEQPITLLCIFISVGIMLLSSAIEEEFLGPEELRDGIDLILGLLSFLLIFSGVPFFILCSNYKKATAPLVKAIIISTIITTFLLYIRTMLYLVFCPFLTTIIFIKIVKNSKKYDQTNYMNNFDISNSNDLNTYNEWDTSSWDSPNSGTEYNYDDNSENPIK